MLEVLLEALDFHLCLRLLNLTKEGQFHVIETINCYLYLLSQGQNRRSLVGTVGRKDRVRLPGQASGRNMKQKYSSSAISS